MKKIMAATFAAFALLLANSVDATATPMCDNHVDHGDQAYGPQAGDKYVTACAGDSGPDNNTNPVVPVPHLGDHW